MTLLAEIEYRAKSAEGKVRHLFFKGYGTTFDQAFAQGRIPSIEL